MNSLWQVIIVLPISYAEAPASRWYGISPLFESARPLNVRFGRRVFHQVSMAAMILALLVPIFAYTWMGE